MNGEGIVDLSPSDLHSWWEVPSIAHFFSLFAESFGLLDFDIEEFEEWLIEDGVKPEGSPFLRELIRRLLKGCYRKRTINHENYEFYFRDFIKKKWELEQGRENPFYQPDMNLHSLPLRTKVEMLQALCDYRLTAEDAVDKLKRIDVDDLRKVPVGADAQGGLYWYFYGTRLYREQPAEKSKLTQTTTKKKPGPKPGTKRKRKDSAEEDEDVFTDKSDVEKLAGGPRKQFGSVSAATSSKILLPKQLQDLVDESNTNDSDSSLSMLSFPFPLHPPSLKLPPESGAGTDTESSATIPSGVVRPDITAHMSTAPSTACNTEEDIPDSEPPKSKQKRKYTKRAPKDTPKTEKRTVKSAEPKQQISKTNKAKSRSQNDARQNLQSNSETKKGEELSGKCEKDNVSKSEPVVPQKVDVETTPPESKTKTSKPRSKNSKTAKDRVDSKSKETPKKTPPPRRGRSKIPPMEDPDSKSLSTKDAMETEEKDSESPSKGNNITTANNTDENTHKTHVVNKRTSTEVAEHSTSKVGDEMAVCEDHPSVKSKGAKTVNKKSVKTKAAETKSLAGAETPASKQRKGRNTRRNVARKANDSGAESDGDGATGENQQKTGSPEESEVTVRVTRRKTAQLRAEELSAQKAAKAVSDHKEESNEATTVPESEQTGNGAEIHSGEKIVEVVSSRKKAIKEPDKAVPVVAEELREKSEQDDCKTESAAKESQKVENTEIKENMCAKSVVETDLRRTVVASPSVEDTSQGEKLTEEKEATCEVAGSSGVVTETRQEDACEPLNLCVKKTTEGVTSGNDAAAKEGQGTNQGEPQPTAASKDIGLDVLKESQLSVCLGDKDNSEVKSQESTDMAKSASDDKDDVNAAAKNQDVVTTATAGDRAVNTSSAETAAVQSGLLAQSATSNKPARHPPKKRRGLLDSICSTLIKEKESQLKSAQSSGENSDSAPKSGVPQVDGVYDDSDDESSALACCILSKNTPVSSLHEHTFRDASGRCDFRNSTNCVPRCCDVNKTCGRHVTGSLGQVSALSLYFSLCDQLDGQNDERANGKANGPGSPGTAKKPATAPVAMQQAYEVIEIVPEDDSQEGCKYLNGPTNGPTVSEPRSDSVTHPNKIQTGNHVTQFFQDSKDNVLQIPPASNTSKKPIAEIDLTADDDEVIDTGVDILKSFSVVAANNTVQKCTTTEYLLDAFQKKSPASPVGEKSKCPTAVMTEYLRVPTPSVKPIEASAKSFTNCFEEFLTKRTGRSSSPAYPLQSSQVAKNVGSESAATIRKPTTSTTFGQSFDKFLAAQRQAPDSDPSDVKASETLQQDDESICRKDASFGGRRSRGRGRTRSFGRGRKRTEEVDSEEDESEDEWIPAKKKSRQGKKGAGRRHKKASDTEGSDPEWGKTDSQGSQDGKAAVLPPPEPEVSDESSASMSLTKKVAKPVKKAKNINDPGAVFVERARRSLRQRIARVNYKIDLELDSDLDSWVGDTKPSEPEEASAGEESEKEDTEEEEEEENESEEESEEKEKETGDKEKSEDAGTGNKPSEGETAEKSKSEEEESEKDEASEEQQGKVEESLFRPLSTEAASSEESDNEVSNEKTRTKTNTTRAARSSSSDVTDNPSDADYDVRRKRRGGRGRGRGGRRGSRGGRGRKVSSPARAEVSRSTRLSRTRNKSAPAYNEPGGNEELNCNNNANPEGTTTDQGETSAGSQSCEELPPDGSVPNPAHAQSSHDKPIKASTDRDKSAADKREPEAHLKTTENVSDIQPANKENMNKKTAFDVESLIDVKEKSTEKTEVKREENRNESKLEVNVELFDQKTVDKEAAEKQISKNMKQSKKNAAKCSEISQVNKPTKSQEKPDTCKDVSGEIKDEMKSDENTIEVGEIVNDSKNQTVAKSKRNPRKTSTKSTKPNTKIRNQDKVEGNEQSDSDGEVKTAPKKQVRSAKKPRKTKAEMTREESNDAAKGDGLHQPGSPRCAESDKTIDKDLKENEKEEKSEKNETETPRRQRTPRKTKLTAIERLKEEERKDSSATDEYYNGEELEVASARKKRTKQRPVAATGRSKEISRKQVSDDGGGETEGTEDYWSEEEDEMLKVEPSTLERFRKTFEEQSKSKWSLVCKTLDDWKCLANKLKGSQVRCEQRLQRCIIEDFLPQMPTLLEYKVKQKRDREAELIKLQERALRAADEESSESDEEERSVLQAQREEQLRLIREEREKKMQERARRARAREMRAEGIEAEHSDSEFETPARELRTRARLPSNDSESSLDEEIVEALTKVLHAVQNHDEAWPFNDPVDEEYAPGYYDVIEDPMDLSKIENKLESGLYKTVQQFEADFTLMWENCEEYNGEDSEYTEVAQMLDGYFKRCMLRYMPKKRHVDSDREDFESPAEKTPRSRCKKAGPEKSGGRSRRVASSRARTAIKYTDMSSDELDTSRDDTRVEEPTKAASKTKTKRRKKDASAVAEDDSAGAVPHGNVGLSLAPAPEKCGGGPSDMVHIQRVDRENPPPQGFPHPYMGPGHPPSGPWPGQHPHYSAGHPGFYGAPPGYRGPPPPYPQGPPRAGGPMGPQRWTMPPGGPRPGMYGPGNQFPPQPHMVGPPMSKEGQSDQNVPPPHGQPVQKPQGQPLTQAQESYPPRGPAPYGHFMQGPPPPHIRGQTMPRMPPHMHHPPSQAMQRPNYPGGVPYPGPGMDPRGFQGPRGHHPGMRMDGPMMRMMAPTSQPEMRMDAATSQPGMRMEAPPPQQPGLGKEVVPPSSQPGTRTDHLIPPQPGTIGDASRAPLAASIDTAAIDTSVSPSPGSHQSVHSPRPPSLSSPKLPGSPAHRSDASHSPALSSPVSTSSTTHTHTGVPGTTMMGGQRMPPPPYQMGPHPQGGPYPVPPHRMYGHAYYGPMHGPPAYGPNQYGYPPRGPQNAQRMPFDSGHMMHPANRMPQAGHMGYHGPPPHSGVPPGPHLHGPTGHESAKTGPQLHGGQSLNPQPQGVPLAGTKPAEMLPQDPRVLPHGQVPEQVPPQMNVPAVSVHTSQPQATLAQGPVPTSSPPAQAFRGNREQSGGTFTAMLQDMDTPSSQSRTQTAESNVVTSDSTPTTAAMPTNVNTTLSTAVSTATAAVASSVSTVSAAEVPSISQTQPSSPPVTASQNINADVVSEKPEMMDKKPEAVDKKPEVVDQKPEVVDQKPGGIDTTERLNSDSKMEAEENAKVQTDSVKVAKCDRTKPSDSLAHLLSHDKIESTVESDVSLNKVEEKDKQTKDSKAQDVPAESSSSGCSEINTRNSELSAKVSELNADKTREHLDQVDVQDKSLTSETVADASEKEENIGKAESEKEVESSKTVVSSPSKLSQLFMGPPPGSSQASMPGAVGPPGAGPFSPSGNSETGRDSSVMAQQPSSANAPGQSAGIPPYQQPPVPPYAQQMHHPSQQPGPYPYQHMPPYSHAPRMPYYSHQQQSGPASQSAMPGGVPTTLAASSTEVSHAPGAARDADAAVTQSGETAAQPSDVTDMPSSQAQTQTPQGQAQIPPGPSQIPVSQGHPGMGQGQMPPGQAQGYQQMGPGHPQVSGVQGHPQTGGMPAYGFHGPSQYPSQQYYQQGPYPGQAMDSYAQQGYGYPGQHPMDPQYRPVAPYGGQPGYPGPQYPGAPMPQQGPMPRMPFEGTTDSAKKKKRPRSKKARGEEAEGLDTGGFPQSPEEKPKRKRSRKKKADVEPEPQAPGIGMQIYGGQFSQGAPPYSGQPPMASVPQGVQGPGYSTAGQPPVALAGMMNMVNQMPPASSLDSTKPSASNSIFNDPRWQNMGGMGPRSSGPYSQMQGPAGMNPRMFGPGGIDPRAQQQIGGGPRTHYPAESANPRMQPASGMDSSMHQPADSDPRIQESRSGTPGIQKPAGTEPRLKSPAGSVTQKAGDQSMEEAEEVAKRVQSPSGTEEKKQHPGGVESQVNEQDNRLPGGVDPRMQNPSGMDPRMQNPSGMGPRMQNPSGMDPRMQNPSGMDPRMQNPSRMDPRMQNPSGIDPRMQNPSGMDLRMQNPNGMDPRMQNPSGMDPRMLTASGIDPRMQRPSGMDPRMQNPSGMDPRMLNPSGMDPRIQIPSGMDPRMPNPSGLDPRMQNPSGMDPRMQNPSGIDQRMQHQGVFDPRMLHSSGKDPRMKQPGEMDARVQSPSGMDPRMQHVGGLGPRMQQPGGIDPRMQPSGGIDPRMQHSGGIDPRMQRPSGVDPRKQHPSGIDPRMQHPDPRMQHLDPRKQRTDQSDPSMDHPNGMDPRMQLTGGMDSRTQHQGGVDSRMRHPSGIDPRMQHPSSMGSRMQHPGSMDPRLQHPGNLDPSMKQPVGLDPRMQNPVGLDPRIQQHGGMGPRMQHPGSVDPRLQYPGGIDPRLQSGLGVDHRMQYPMGTDPRMQDPGRNPSASTLESHLIDGAEMAVSVSSAAANLAATCSQNEEDTSEEKKGVKGKKKGKATRTTKAKTKTKRSEAPSSGPTSEQVGSESHKADHSVILTPPDSPLSSITVSKGLAQMEGGAPISSPPPMGSPAPPSSSFSASYPGPQNPSIQASTSHGFGSSKMASYPGEHARMRGPPPTHYAMPQQQQQQAYASQMQYGMRGPPPGPYGPYAPPPAPPTSYGSQYPPPPPHAMAPGMMYGEQYPYYGMLPRPSYMMQQNPYQGYGTVSDVAGDGAPPAPRPPATQQGSTSPGPQYQQL